MDITITHKPLNREEIAALTSTVLHDSPRGGYRLLWGTMLFCGGYALYRGGAAATLPILILTGFYFFCAKRLFWPNRKLQEEDCRRILSARPYYSMPYTVTLTDDELSLDSSVHAFSTDYRMLGPVMQVPCGTDELLYFPNTVSLVLRRSEFPQREDYDAFLAKLTEVGKSNREPSSPATPGFQRRLALVRCTIWVQGLPRDAVLAMVNALFCTLLLWQGAKLPFFPAFGAVFLWNFCGFRLILMNRQKRNIRENQSLLPAEFHFHFDREHGMLEGRTERSVNRISVSYLTSSREKDDCLILKTGLFPWCMCFREEFSSPENWTEFLQTMDNQAEAAKQVAVSDAPPETPPKRGFSWGCVIWVAIFLYLFFRCFGCFDSDRMTFAPTPSAPPGEVPK